MKRYLNGYPEVFDPDIIRILTAALDDAWQTVQASGATYAENGLTEVVRATLAQYIIAAAQQGEFDQRRLSQGALTHLVELYSRKSPSTGR